MMDSNLHKLNGIAHSIKVTQDFLEIEKTGLEGKEKVSLELVQRSLSIALSVVDSAIRDYRRI